MCRLASIGTALLAALLVPGVLWGGSPAAALELLAFLVGWVLLPGLTSARWLAPERDGLAALALGLVTGTALEGLVLLACRAAGSFTVLLAWPASALVFTALARAFPLLPGEPRARSARGAWLFLPVLVLVLLRAPVRSGDPAEACLGLENDLLFHAGNAAELTRSGPLLDPRVAGRPLNYHLLAHALFAGARLVTGVPIVELFRTWLAGFHPLLLVLLVFVLGRELGGSALSGLLAGLVLVLHAELGWGLFEDASPPALLFHSYLDLGLFESPSTACGLALLAALALVLLRRLEPPARSTGRSTWLLALLALAASLAKGSVMPVALAGIFIAFAAESARTHRWSRRWASVLLVCLVAALPGTLWLALGPGSFAGAMFRVAPFAGVTSSGAGSWLLRAARLPAWLPDALIGPALSLPWLAGFLGLGGLGVAAWLAAGRPGLGGLGPWILGMSGPGLGAALLLLAPGSSELFFAYDAQVLLAVVAGTGTAALLRRAPRSAAMLGLVAAPFLLAGLGATARSLRQRVEAPPADMGAWLRWSEGAQWLCEHAEPEALVVARHGGILLSAFAERRAALEPSTYRPEVHGARWRRVDGSWRLGPVTAEPFPELAEACARALEQGDRESLAHLRESARWRGALYLVSDRVRVSLGRSVEIEVVLRTGAGSLDASSCLEACFANEAVAVYRARD